MLLCRYEGEFVEGKMEGQGVYTFEDGGCFTGAFHNNKKDGKGCMVAKDGEEWEGTWVNDSRQGTVSVFPASKMKWSRTSKIALMYHPTSSLALHEGRFTERPH